MSRDFNRNIGHRLHLLRLQRNMTQEQISDALNLSTSAYCKIEYGKTDLTLSRLHEIAMVMELSDIELFAQLGGGRNPF